jgi:hypothetical protein
LGVFFVVLGILGLTQYTSKTSEFLRMFGRNNIMTLVVAVVQFLAGAILVLGLFMSVGSGLAKLISIAVFVLWAFYMVMTLGINGFLKPDLLGWLYKASWNTVILASLWITGRKYMG